jgi:ureidoacrylate peracid hydrolase
VRKRRSVISRRQALGVLVQGAASAALVGCTHEAPALNAPALAPRASLVTLDAKPNAFTFNPAKTAVIVVDLQNDFGSKGGLFDRLGLDLAGVQKAAATTAGVLASARKAGIKIVYLKMGFRPDLSDMGAEDSRNRVGHLRAGAGQTVTAPDGKPSRILIRDTWNTAVLPIVEPAPGDIQIYKHHYSGFFRTELDATLKSHGIKHLVFTGCTTSVCVESTLRDAMYRDYLCVLLADCTSERVGSDLPRTNHDATIAIIQAQFGWVSESDRFTKAISA